MGYGWLLSTAKRMKGSSTRSWLGRGLYVLLLLGFVEISLQLLYRFTAGRWLPTRTAHPVFAPNPVMGFMNRPNLAYVLVTPEFRTHLYTNSEGFRTSPARESYALQKRAGTLRLMLLGPSFAFGWGVEYEDSCARRIEVELREAHLSRWRDVEVINAGVNGMYPEPQLRWYRAVGTRYAPDLVVQFVYGSMAVDVRQEAPYRVTDDYYLVPTEGSELQRAIALVKRSAVVFYGWVLWNQIEAALGLSGNSLVVGAGRELRIQPPFDPASRDLQGSLAYFDALRSTVEGSGAALALVYFPLSYAVHRADRSRWAHQGVHDVDSQIRFDAAFCAHLRARGVDCLDITPDLLAAAAAGGERLYYWLDVHWTRRGNDVAAHTIARHLIRLLEGEALNRRATVSARRP